MDTENVCELCYAHEQAYKKLPDAILCPKCNSEIYFQYDYFVLGKDNKSEPGEKLIKTHISRCHGCGECIALIPQQIIWNANHDVYYTGSGSYLINKEDIFLNIRKKIEPHIEAFLERLSNGNPLKPWHLALWIQYDIEEAIAEYLEKNK